MNYNHRNMLYYSKNQSQIHSTLKLQKHSKGFFEVQTTGSKKGHIYILKYYITPLHPSYIPTRKEDQEMVVFECYEWMGMQQIYHNAYHQSLPPSPAAAAEVDELDDE